MIEAQSARLRLLQNAEGARKFRQKERVDKISTNQEDEERRSFIGEFQDQMLRERREDASQRLKSKDLIRSMTDAKGVEQKLDTIIAVLADFSG